MWQAPLRYFEMLNESERVALAADEHLFVELACIWCGNLPLLKRWALSWLGAWLTGVGHMGRHARKRSPVQAWMLTRLLAAQDESQACWLL